MKDNNFQVWSLPGDFFLKPPTSLHGCQYHEIQMLLAFTQYRACPKLKSGWKESGTGLWQLKTLSGDHAAAAPSSLISRGRVYSLKISPIPPSLHMCRGARPCLNTVIDALVLKELRQLVSLQDLKTRKKCSCSFFRSWSELKKHVQR